MLDAELGANSKMSFIAVKNSDLYHIILKTLETR
jgi:hypothetical protein